MIEEIMGYNLQKDFEYVQSKLCEIIIFIGGETDVISSYNINTLLQMCVDVYGQNNYNDAELLSLQQSLRRLWYMYTVLKWRLENV
jgi:hypothetical protein